MPVPRPRRCSPRRAAARSRSAGRSVRPPRDHAVRTDRPFRKADRAIEVETRSFPWGDGTDYRDRLFAALAAGHPPDCAMLELASRAPLLEAGALGPLDELLRCWPGRADIGEDLRRIIRAAAGRHCHLPVRDVLLCRRYRADRFARAGLAPPSTFEAFLAAARASHPRR